MHMVSATFPGSNKDAESPLTESETEQLVALIEKSGPEDWGVEQRYDNEEPVSVEAWASYSTASAAMKAKTEWRAWADAKQLNAKVSAKKMRDFDDDEPISMVDPGLLNRPRKVTEGEARTLEIADEELREMGLDDDQEPIPRGQGLRLVPPKKNRRRRSSKRNLTTRNPMKMKSVTWGTLPEFPEFKAHVDAMVDDDGDPVVGPDGGDVYHMELVGRDKESAKTALKTLLATGTRVKFDQFEGRHGKFGLRFLDLVSLHKFILALLTISEMEDPDDNGEGPGDLASSIMGQLGYEWV